MRAIDAWHGFLSLCKLNVVNSSKYAHGSLIVRRPCIVPNHRVYPVGARQDRRADVRSRRAETRIGSVIWARKATLCTTISPPQL